MSKTKNPEGDGGLPGFRFFHWYRSGTGCDGLHPSVLARLSTQLILLIRVLLAGGSLCIGSVGSGNDVDV
jgi:hypothetical protein